MKFSTKMISKKMMIPIIGMAVIFAAAMMITSSYISSSAPAPKTKWVTLESSKGEYLWDMKFLIMVAIDEDPVSVSCDPVSVSCDRYLHKKDGGREYFIYTKNFMHSQVEEIDCDAIGEDDIIATVKCNMAYKADIDSLKESNEVTAMFSEYINFKFDHVVMNSRSDTPSKTPMDTTTLTKTSQWIDAGGSTGISFMVFDGSDLIYIKEYENIEVIDCSIKPQSTWIMPKCMLAELLWVEEVVEEWKAKFESFQKNKRSTNSYLDLVDYINNDLDGIKDDFESTGSGIKEINKAKRRYLKFEDDVPDGRCRS